MALPILDLSYVDLSEGQQATYGVETVEIAVIDGYGNGYVPNLTRRPNLPGMRAMPGLIVETRKIEDRGLHRGTDGQIIQTPLVQEFTDAAVLPYMLGQVERSLGREDDRIRQIGGLMTVAADIIPQWRYIDVDSRQRVMEALARILAFERPRVESKVQAVGHVAAAAIVLENKASDPVTASEELEQANAYFQDRRGELKRQSRVLEERRRRFVGYALHERDIKAQLVEFADRNPSITDNNMSEFRNLARQRVFKPGLHTVINTLRRLHEPDALRKMIVAQEGWEELYPALGRPMRYLISAKNISSAAVSLQPYIEDLKLVIQLSSIGGDYSVLAERLEKLRSSVLGHINREEFLLARNSARRYLHWLRYRTDEPKPGRKPVAHNAWYGVRETRHKPNMTGDPFLGLNG